MSAGLTPIATPLIVLVAVVAAVVVAVLAGPVSLVLGVPLVVIGVIAAGGVRLLHVVPERLAENSFGLCSGLTPADSDDPALTDWLHAQIQQLAGRGDEGIDAATRKRPVTFGDLAEHGIELVMLSTNVSRGTSETVPFREDIWAYRHEEFAALFPPEVLEHLRKQSKAPADETQKTELDRLGLTPLPPAAELPIIVGVRMSLAFPVLLAAVPLYALTPQRDEAGWRVTYVQNWFSDGGITSNLPVRMFDAVLPNRPTYGINLSGGGDPAATNPAASIWRPISIRQGGLPPTASISSITGLLSGVFDTMQNWADNDDSRTVGFRDRICTIRLGPSEGGMNLDMPPGLIDGLVAKGACAGDNLASILRGERSCRNEYEQPSGEVTELESHQWDRHRWIRFRMAISGVAQLVQGISTRWVPADGSPGYRDLSETVTPDAPGWQSYRSDWSGTRSSAYREAIDEMLESGSLSAGWIVDGDPAGFGVGFGPDRRAGTVTEPAPDSGPQP